MRRMWIRLWRHCRSASFTNSTVAALPSLIGHHPRPDPTLKQRGGCWRLWWRLLEVAAGVFCGVAGGCGGGWWRLRWKLVEVAGSCSGLVDVAGGCGGGWWRLLAVAVEVGGGCGGGWWRWLAVVEVGGGCRRLWWRLAEIAVGHGWAVSSVWVRDPPPPPPPPSLPSGPT